MARSNLDIQQLIFPTSGLFAERALRLRALADGHPMGDYLMLMALVCEAQDVRLKASPTFTLPTAKQIDAAAASGQPLLSTSHWPRDPVWRSQWRAMITQVVDQIPSHSPAFAGVQAVLALDDEQLEQQADRLLAGITLGLDMASAPIIAAGLQLYWTRLIIAAVASDANVFGKPGDEHTHCPCCGSLPTASITRSGKGKKGQRYLHCSLCQTEWKMPFIKCTHCLTTSDIHYESLQAVDEDPEQAKPQAIEAETCSACHHYLKLMHTDRGGAHLDPIADDLASLTLDLLVSDAGFTRHGTNLLLLFGDPQDEA